MFEDEIETVNAERQIFYKTILVKCGIFCGLIAAFFSVLILFVMLGRNSWKAGLKREAVQVLSENGLEKIKVGDWINSKTAVAVSACSYKAVAEDGKTEMFVVLVRVPTLYGPVSAVYVCSAEGRAEFVGLADVSGKTAEKICGNSENAQIEYWRKKVPVIAGIGDS
ncbi:hypothetical protein [Treponema sp.]|uniref:hypothetical protein n=1 Tax=Treponema sp. TaxID=166 RepID=UPI003F05FB3F